MCGRVFLIAAGENGDAYLNVGPDAAVLPQHGSLHAALVAQPNTLTEQALRAHLQARAYID